MADGGEGAEEADLKAELLVEPGIVNDRGGLGGKRLEQFLVRRGEGVGAVGIHVEDAADFALNLERHGQLGTDLRPHA